MIVGEATDESKIVHSVPWIVIRRSYRCVTISARKHKQRMQKLVLFPESVRAQYRHPLLVPTSSTDRMARIGVHTIIVMAHPRFPTESAPR